MTPRYYHTATLLPSGKVLVAGGDTSGFSAELYDPVSGTFATTGSLAMARALHTATLLPSGKVLVAGGESLAAAAELYDPATGTFSATGSLATPRYYHTATLLPSGKVLVAGGLNFVVSPTDSGAVRPGVRDLQCRGVPRFPLPAYRHPPP